MDTKKQRFYQKVHYASFLELQSKYITRYRQLCEQYKVLFLGKEKPAKLAANKARYRLVKENQEEFSKILESKKIEMGYK